MIENIEQNITGDFTGHTTASADFSELARDFITSDEIRSQNERIVENLNGKVMDNFFRALDVLKLAKESGQISDEDFQQRLIKLDLLSNETFGYTISSLAIDRYNQDNLPYIIEKENYELKQIIESKHVIIGSFKFFNGKLFYTEEVDDDFTNLCIAQQNNSGEFEQKQAFKINDESGIRYLGFWKNKAVLVDSDNAMMVNLESSSEGSDLLKWDLLDQDQDIDSAQLLPDNRLAVGTENGKLLIYDLENQGKEPTKINLGENPISYLSVYKNTLFAAEGRNSDNKFREYGTFKIELDSPNLSTEAIFERPENRQEKIQAVTEDIYFYTSAGFANICQKVEGSNKWKSREWARGGRAPIEEYKVLLKGEKFIRVDHEKDNFKYNLIFFDRSGNDLLLESFNVAVQAVQIIPDGKIFVLSGNKIYIFDGEMKND